MKTVKNVGPSFLKAVGQLSPSNLEACESRYRLVLCDNDYELSSLPDQATQGQ